MRMARADTPGRFPQEASMQPTPFDPRNPLHTAALSAAMLAALAVAMVIADLLIPALVRWQIGGAW